MMSEAVLDTMQTNSIDLASANSFADNPALYTTKDHRIYIAPSPSLEPGPDDCIVHVRANGICG
jgi:hypothetical protein